LSSESESFGSRAKCCRWASRAGSASASASARIRNFVRNNTRRCGLALNTPKTWLDSCRYVRALSSRKTRDCPREERHRLALGFERGQKVLDTLRKVYHNLRECERTRPGFFHVKTGCTYVVRGNSGYRLCCSRGHYDEYAVRGGTK
jgi:hypothetical protein